MYSIMVMSNNNHELLQRCIDLVVAHTPLEYEFVIVDDASDPAYSNGPSYDGTGSLGIDFHGKPTTIVRMPKRSNCCNLRNVGMEMSQGEWVFWVDNDSFVGEGWYKPLIDSIGPDIGLIGQQKDSRLIRKPFLPLTQSDCMIEYQFAYDYNHENGECDFITSYCVLVRKEAYRPTYCWNMPTPCLDPELGATIKAMGYKVVVCSEINVSHQGSSTARPNGKEYLYHLAENFTKWWEYWEPYSPKIFELYRDIPVKFNHDQNEPSREASRGRHGDLDLDQVFERIR